MNNTSDKKYMNKAIELAKNGKYRTHPNPLVGAVIVKNDKIISKGYHKRFRGKHAEREAIDRSKESLKRLNYVCNSRAMRSLWKYTTMC